MWWLPRRKGFDVRAWRAPCKCQQGHDVHYPKTRACKASGCRAFDSAYQCIGCDGKQEEHETVFELESERVQAKRDVGPRFMPLADTPELQRALFSSMRPQPLCTSASGGSDGGAGGAADASKERSGDGRSCGTAREDSRAGTSTMRAPAGMAPVGGPPSELSLEELLERGHISPQEYSKRVLTEPPPPVEPPSASGRSLACTGGAFRPAWRPAWRPAFARVHRPHTFDGVSLRSRILLTHSLRRYATRRPGGRTASRPGQSAARGRPPPTLTAFEMPLADGTATILTNSGPPIPQPGHDWTRPWEPAGALPLAGWRCVPERPSAVRRP